MDAIDFEPGNYEKVERKRVCGYKQVKWVKRCREIMNTQVLVVNGSNDVIEVSSLFVSLYVQLLVSLNFTLCVK